MSQEVAVTKELDRLLGLLETRGSNAPVPDAIDEVLASPPRVTAIRSLRDSPEVEAFRQALVDGLIRADTVNQLLRLVTQVLVRWVR